MAAEREFSLADFSPARDGVRDDTAALQSCFAAVATAGGGVVKIPPGAYAVGGGESVILSSHTTVLAEGALFCLPEHLKDRARIDLFSGTDIQDFHWRGGTFVGHCFDHRTPPNTWEPNVTTRMILITTTPGGMTDNLTFADIQGERVAGAVVTVQGALDPASENAIHTPATHVSVRNCLLQQCGKFMWDYGLLWQILVWPEDYAPADVAMAERYFWPDLIRGPVRMQSGDDRVWLDNAQAPIGISANDSLDAAVCFFGDTLPANILRGRQYFVVHSQADSIRISDRPGGAPIRFDGNSGANLRCIPQLHKAYYHLFWPIGTGGGKGAVDLMGCRHVQMSGNTLSALGDTMHIQHSENIVFANNQITGSRMGAFFLAEHCRNATITGNTVDGTNGSRVMSVERSCREVTIVGNTFRGGGRGSWINQPQGIVIANNIFINNTTKGERTPWRGRRLPETGDYGTHPELYFTTWEKGGTYGPVIVRDNIFDTGDECPETIRFHAGGHDLIVAGNVFQGRRRTVRVDAGCEAPRIRDNIGLEA